MTIRSTRRFAVPVFLACLVVGAAAPALAVDFGVRAGGYLDEKDPFVALELLLPFGGKGLAFDPNVELVDAARSDRLSLNLDLRYDFLAATDYAVWAGGGLALIHTDGDRGRDDDDEIGANLLGGVDWRLRSFTPYALIKIVIADDSEVAAGVGIRF